MAGQQKILIVDDEPLNLKILKERLHGKGYDIVEAEDGLQALECLRKHQDFNVILLDRMMPNMDGMEVLEKISSDNTLSRIPVIMQTAAVAQEQIKEGINAGVFYYLTKPFEKDVLFAIVESAIRDAAKKTILLEDIHKNHYSLGLMESGLFKLQTLEEARNISQFLANCYPEPEKVVLGLSELIINAVEHGNLGITFNQKADLLSNKTWEEEISKRLKSSNKYVTLTFSKTPDEIKLYIEDEGNGFNWKSFLSLSPERAVTPNGRGIAMSKILSFDSVEYNDVGNKVTCTVQQSK